MPVLGGVERGAATADGGRRTANGERPRRVRAGTRTIRGATSGNGIVSAGVGITWPKATLQVGHSTDADLSDYTGTISNVEGLP
jgi:hypothetical protein